MLKAEGKGQNEPRTFRLFRCSTWHKNAINTLHDKKRKIMPARQINDNAHSRFAKATKRTAKGHLSEAKRPSFGRQKGIFCKRTHNRLIFKKIHNV